MLIIEVTDNEEIIIKAEGNPVNINSDLVIGIKAYHDSMVKHEDSKLMKALAHDIVLKALELAIDLIND